MKDTSNNDIYEIRLKGHLNESWVDWFDGVTFTHEDDGTTTLIGNIKDQSALHGLLKRVRDLGLPLISVNQVESGETTKLDE
jgi:hypothetical protein